MLFCQQKRTDTAIQLFGRFLDGLHHKLVRISDLALQLIRLFNLGRSQLNESLPIERMSLINGAINQ